MEHPSKAEVGVVKQGVLRSLSKPSKKQLVYLGLLLIIFLVASLILIRNYQQQKLSIEESDMQHAEARLDFNKKNPPPSNASNAEKISYYARIVEGEYTAGNYKIATEEYNKLHDFAKGEVLPYGAYKSAALSYARIGDKETALKVLNEVEKMIQDSKPAADDSGLRSELLMEISNLKKDVAK
jgi:hypothetical protein